MVVHTVVLVEWRDARMEPLHVHFALDDPDLGVMPMISAGLLIKEDEHCIALAVDCNNLDDQDRPYRQVSTIPKENVVKIKRWRVSVPTNRG